MIVYIWDCIFSNVSLVFNSQLYPTIVNVYNAFFVNTSTLIKVASGPLHVASSLEMTAMPLLH